MNTDTTTLVSIIVPSYNQGHFIEDTIRSILRQDYPNIEVLVVDGESTDGTLDVLERYREQVRYVSEADSGQSDAINKGFRMARGDIVAWLNSDDIYPRRDAVSRIVNKFSEVPEVDFVYGDFIEIDNNNTVLKLYPRPSYSHNRLLRIGYISQPATFFRRRVIDAMSVREDLQYAMDLEYWLQARSLGFQFIHINHLIAAERLHDDAKCVKDNSDMAIEARSVRMRYGAAFNRRHGFQRFMDRALLYLCRLRGAFSLAAVANKPEMLTIPLHFKGAMQRTLLFTVSNR